MENWDLIVKYLTKEISDDDLEKLNNWLEQNEDNRKQLDRAKSIFTSSGNLLKTYSPDTEGEWDKLKAKINEKPTSSSAVTPLWKKHWWKVAATGLLLFGISFLFKNEKVEEYIEEIALITITTLDSVQIVELPDNSIIHLNKNSTISYAEDFVNIERNVNLIGEAFFEIEADSLHPFVVIAGSTKTSVLGTKFNIKAYEKEDNIEVAVIEGKVAFSNSNEKVVLIKNNSVNYNHKTQKMSKVKKSKIKMKWWAKDLEKDVKKLFKKIKKKIK